MKKAYAIAGIVTLFFVLAPAGIGSSLQTDEKDAPETLIKAARFLEQKPLDKDAKNSELWPLSGSLSLTRLV